MKHLFILLVLLSLATFSCRRDEDYLTVGNPKAMSIQDIIRWTAVPGPGVADDASVVLLTVHIDPEADSLGRQISVSTGLGRFSNSDSVISITVDGYGNATIPIHSNKDGEALLRATIGKYAVDTSIEFDKAFPEDMTFTADKYLMDTTMSSTLTCILYRANGKATDGQKLTFTVTPDVAGTPLLLVPDFAYTSGQTATATLTNPYHSLGWFTVEARTLRSATDTIKRTIRIRIE
jgi:hypothetical protein